MRTAYCPGANLFCIEYADLQQQALTILWSHTLSSKDMRTTDSPLIFVLVTLQPKKTSNISLHELYKHIYCIDPHILMQMEC